MGFFLILVTFSQASSAAEPIKILALGDSLTAGYGLPKGDAFPVLLEQALNKRGKKARVVNGGVSGDTSAGGLARLGWALEGDEDLVIVELGANDGLRGIDPQSTYDNLDRLIGALKGRGVKVLLTGMLAPPNLGKEYGAEFNAVYPALSKKHDVALYPFFLEGVAAVPELNQEDGIHPTRKGVEKIVANIIPFVERLLEARQ